MHQQDPDGPQEIKIDSAAAQEAIHKAKVTARKHHDAVDKEGMADFVRKAEETQKLVRDIIDGKIDIEELDRIEREKEQMEKGQNDVREREALERKLKGRKGKGHKDNYKWFCARCHTEYLYEEITRCTHCGNEDLVTPTVSSRIFLTVIRSASAN